MMKQAIEKIQQKVSIIDIASLFFNLTKRGDKYVTHCLHGSDSDPSLYFYPNQNKCYCFGCKKACNNIVEFVQWIKNCSEQEALLFIQNTFNVDVNINEPKYLKDLRKYIEVCHNKLLNNSQYLKYLNQRGYTLDSIKTFQLGLSNGAIVYPIANEYGTYVGKALRQFNRLPKYINDATNEYFKKKNILFGLNYCRKFFNEERHLVIVEGYNDALILLQNKIPAVSLMGTSFSSEHLQLLNKFGIKAVTIFLDGDEAGLRSTENIIQMLKDTDIVVYVMNELGFDPDEIANKQQEHMSSYIKANRNIWYNYQFNQIIQKYSTQIMSLEQNMASEIKTLKQSLPKNVVDIVERTYQKVIKNF